jgi:hypothetical protein
VNETLSASHLLVRNARMRGQTLIPDSGKTCIRRKLIGVDEASSELVHGSTSLTWERRMAPLALVQDVLRVSPGTTGNRAVDAA